MARYRRTRRSRRPLRRSRRRPRRRSFSRRRRTGRNNLVRGQRPMARFGYLLPKKVLMTTTYSAVVEDMAAAAYDEWIINASSVYDPDQTNIGHQAMLFDQMMVLYNRFFVRACRIKAVLLPGSTGVFASTGRIYALTNNSSSSMGVINPTTLREQPKLYQGSWGYQIDGRVYKNVHNFGVTPKSVVPQWSPINPDCLGTITSNPPGDNCYVHVVVTSGDENTALNAKWYLQVWYDVEYSLVDDYLQQS